MLRRRHWFIALAVLAALIAAPGAALAQSAGNQQYIDPLAGTTNPSPTGSSHSGPSQSSPSSSGAPTSSGATTGSSSTSSSQGSTTTTSTSSGTSSSGTQSSGSQTSSSGTLPRTGLDLAPCLAVACVLLAAGVTLRRVTRPE